MVLSILGCVKQTTFFVKRRPLFCILMTERYSKRRSRVDTAPISEVYGDLKI